MRTMFIVIVVTVMMVSEVLASEITWVRVSRAVHAFCEHEIEGERVTWGDHDSSAELDGVSIYADADAGASMVGTFDNNRIQTMGRLRIPPFTSGPEGFSFSRASTDLEVTFSIATPVAFRLDLYTSDSTLRAPSLRLSGPNNDIIDRFGQRGSTVSESGLLQPGTYTLISETEGESPLASDGPVAELEFDLSLQLCPSGAGLPDCDRNGIPNACELDLGACGGCHLQQQVVLVHDRGTDTVAAYDPNSQTPLGVLSISNAGSFGYPNGTSVYQDTAFISSAGSNSVFQVRLPSGAPLRELRDPSLSGPVGLHVDAGVLYVANYGGDNVLGFDAETGVALGALLVNQTGQPQLDGPTEIIADGSGLLLVASQKNDQVLAFDAGGNFVRVAAHGGGLDYPAGLLQDDAGHLLVASFRSNQVLRYDGSTGAFLDVLVGDDAGTPGEDESGGLDWPEGLARSPHGTLLVSSRAGGEVLEYDLDTGAFLRVFAGDCVEEPTYLETISWSMDCDGNAESDACQSEADCDGNGVPDQCEPDCDGDGIADVCELLNGSEVDCNLNGIPDSCEILPLKIGADCNNNGVNDSCEISDGSEADCNGNQIPDSCEISDDSVADCNNNQVPDACEIADGSVADCTGNGIPDSCEPADCDCDGIRDSQEVPGPMNGGAIHFTAPQRIDFRAGGIQSGSITIEAWVRPDVLTGSRTIVQLESNNYSLQSIDGQVVFGYDSVNGETYRYNLNGFLHRDSWTHIAIVYTFATPDVTAYLNGIPTTGSWEGASPAELPATITAPDVYIGNDTTSNSPWIGMIDEIRVWRVARSAEELRLSRRTPGAWDSDLWTLVNFDEYEDNLIREVKLDEYYYLRPGVAWKSTYFCCDAPVSGTDCECALANPLDGTALEFSSTDARLDFSGALYDVESGWITIEAWIHPYTNTGTRTILQKRPNNYWLRVINGQLVFLYAGDQSYRYVVDSALGATEWVHVALVHEFGTSNITAYVNGAVVEGTWTTRLPDSLPVVDPAQDLLIGNNGPRSSAWVGLLDELRVWDVERSVADVRNLMGQAVDPNAPGLRVLIPFERGSTPSLVNEEIGNNAATLPGGTGWVPGICEPCMGDTDGDGDSDLTDLASLLGNFGEVGVGILGDVDGDDDVDLNDLAILLGDFGCQP